MDGDISSPPRGIVTLPKETVNFEGVHLAFSRLRLRQEVMLLLQGTPMRPGLNGMISTFKREVMEAEKENPLRRRGGVLLVTGEFRRQRPGRNSSRAGSNALCGSYREIRKKLTSTVFAGGGGIGGGKGEISCLWGTRRVFMGKRDCSKREGVRHQNHMQGKAVPLKEGSGLPSLEILEGEGGPLSRSQKKEKTAGGESQTGVVILWIRKEGRIPRTRGIIRRARDTP